MSIVSIASDVLYTNLDQFPLYSTLNDALVKGPLEHIREEGKDMNTHGLEGEIEQIATGCFLPYPNFPPSKGKRLFVVP